jgi:hypothetical protein
VPLARTLKSPRSTSSVGKHATGTSVASHDPYPANGRFAGGGSKAEAADIIWAIANANLYRALVHDRRWTTDQYERWLVDLLARSLLAEPAKPAPV